jgi:hypothetical protein
VYRGISENETRESVVREEQLSCAFIFAKLDLPAMVSSWRNLVINIAQASGSASTHISKALFEGS